MYLWGKYNATLISCRLAYNRSDFFATHTRPLNEKEILKLSQKRTRKYIKRNYSFQNVNITVNKQFKSSLNPKGRWYNTQEKLSSFPSYIAALLKGKNTNGLFWLQKRMEQFMDFMPTKAMTTPLFLLIVTWNILWTSANNTSARLLCDSTITQMKTHIIRLACWQVSKTNPVQYGAVLK